MNRARRPDGITTDEDYMSLCLALARRGEGRVSPNPLVGAVLVREREIIGHGCHEYFGGPHAEVNAIKNATAAVAGATLYVNLEPCNIFGKTPPCTDLLIHSKIGEVIVGIPDPNPAVSGKGIAQLRRAGIKVRTNVLGEDCKRLNERFFKYITSGLPFVSIKAAQTLDGKIADTKGKSRWISNLSSRKIAHYLRSQHDAILVGAGTVRHDNPLLSVRLVRGKNPLRIILDGKLSSSTNAVVYQHQNRCQTIVFCDAAAAERLQHKRRKLEKNGVRVYPMATDTPGILPIRKVLRFLGRMGISSLLVEGGSRTISSFIEEGCADKIHLFIAPKILGTGTNIAGGLPAISIGKSFQLHSPHVKKIKDDLLVEAYFHKPIT